MSIITNAIRDGHVELAMMLVKNAVPYQVCQYDDMGQTALHLAVQKNYLDIASALLENGANIDAYGRDEAYHRMTPLHYAALTGNLVAARLLLNWGADISVENGDGLNASSLALKHGFVEIAKAINQHANYKQRFSWPLRLPLSKKTSVKQSGSIDPFPPFRHEKPEASGHKEGANVVDFLAYKTRKNLRPK